MHPLFGVCACGNGLLVGDTSSQATDKMLPLRIKRQPSNSTVLSNQLVVWKRSWSFQSQPFLFYLFISLSLPIFNFHCLFRSLSLPPYLSLEPFMFQQLLDSISKQLFRCISLSYRNRRQLTSVCCRCHCSNP